MTQFFNYIFVPINTYVGGDLANDVAMDLKGAVDTQHLS